MAVAQTGGVVLLPFGERPQYGTPYPEGLGVSNINQVGDASGGDLTMSVLADPGTLFRLEGFNLARGVASIVNDAHIITSHGWVQDKSGLGVSSYDLNWLLEGQAAANFSVYLIQHNTGDADSLAQIRRLPIGRLSGAPGVAQQLMLMTIDNVDTVTHALSVWFTYWRGESLSLPGFLSSFFQSPAVPPLIRQP